MLRRGPVVGGDHIFNSALRANLAAAPAPIRRIIAQLTAHVPFTRADRDGLEVFTALEGRVQFLLKPNPERKTFHTLEVEKNGFIRAMLVGTLLEGIGYAYFGLRAYEP